MDDHFHWNISEYYRSNNERLISWSTNKKTIMYCLSCGQMLFISQGCFQYNEEVPTSIDRKNRILKDVIEYHADGDYIIFSNICKNCAQEMLNNKTRDVIKENLDIGENESSKKKEICIINHNVTAKSNKNIDLLKDLRVLKPGERQGWNSVNPYVFDTLNILKSQINKRFKYKKALLCLNCGHVSVMNDDVSKHEATNLHDKIEVIYNSESIGFIRNCNHYD